MNTRAIIFGGIVASLVIAMWEMVVEAVIPGGAGLFGPPVAIGATLVRDLQGASNPIPFDFAALLVGLAGHMMNSVILAAVFGITIGRRGIGTPGLLVAGIAWGVAVFAAMWFVVVPAVDPLVLNLNGVAFLAGHMMWGAALGLLWYRFGASDRSVSLRAA
ncbi:MAG: hypothetical protein AB1736_03855 [Chloroflexota bacterium]